MQAATEGEAGVKACQLEKDSEALGPRYRQDWNVSWALEHGRRLELMQGQTLEDSEYGKEVV